MTDDEFKADFDEKFKDGDVLGMSRRAWEKLDYGSSLHVNPPSMDRYRDLTEKDAKEIRKAKGK